MNKSHRISDRDVCRSTLCAVLSLLTIADGPGFMKAYSPASLRRAQERFLRCRVRFGVDDSTIPALKGTGPDGGWRYVNRRNSM